MLFETPLHLRISIININHLILKDEQSNTF